MQKKFIQKTHNSTKRNYFKRMNLSKFKKIDNAKKYSKKYWDGSRSEGYGGYHYIPGYWTNVAKKILKNYKLKKNANLLDIGCGKGFLIYEIKKLRPDLNIVGTDISTYALKNAIGKNKIKYCKHRAQDKFKYKSKFFDLAISLGTLHNLELFDLKKSLEEIMRISKKSYIMVESYRNSKELVNLQCWALTCETFFSMNEWIWFFKNSGYKGDYEFIYFK